MARKIANRKELRAENDAAERKKSATKADTPAKKKAAKKKAVKKKAVKKKAAKRKSRSATAKDVRLKAYWGVFSQSLKRVALFEYSQRKDATKKAEALSGSGKSPHFVQLVKEEIIEVEEVPAVEDTAG